MPRTKLELPDTFDFSTELEVNIEHINYGGHLGNDAVLSLMHEARIRFLASRGLTESDACGCGLIMADAVIVFKAQAYRGDRLRFDLGARDFGKYGFDLFYRIVHIKSGKEAVRAKTGMLTFDYADDKMMPVPDALAAALAPSS